GSRSSEVDGAGDAGCRDLPGDYGRADASGAEGAWNGRPGASTNGVAARRFRLRPQPGSSASSGIGIRACQSMGSGPAVVRERLSAVLLSALSS
ncbi:MAG: hypothetical protein QW734_09455, partial [Candidatus Bathyarchaeia archaeon]